MSIRLVVAIMVLVGGQTASAQIAAGNAQPTPLSVGRIASNTVLVVAAAPIFLLPDASRAPLRVAKEGSALRLIERTGDWCNVEFQDPDYGRRVGYIQAKFVQLVVERALEPVDLSLPDARTGQRYATTPVEDLPPPQPIQKTRQSGGMPTRYKVWGGIMLGLGTYYFASYAVTPPNSVVCLVSCNSTNDLRTAWLYMGAGLTAGGVDVLVAGARHGPDTSPSISISPSGVTLHETITLSGKHLHLWR